MTPALPTSDELARPSGRPAATERPGGGPEWWRTAVVYQVYVRSFADGDGDGTGDLAGLRDRLPYLAGLGVDALWLNPWYPSPMVDGGYDVADYRAIHPWFGTLAEAAALIEEVHAHGLRILIDVVPNHTSSEHEWFRAALAGDTAARARYHFAPGLGAAGERPPNNWRSGFGGPAWTRVTEPDGRPGPWYLHLYAPGQPDLNWDNPEVRAEFEDILRFWFDLGVDGFRIDSGHTMVKAPGMPDSDLTWHEAGHPTRDQDGLHEIYRAWRRLADGYEPPRVFVGEIWLAETDRLSLYLRPDELHTVFDAALIRAPWRAAAFREHVENALAVAAATGGPATWVLANHDTVRHATRYGMRVVDVSDHGGWAQRNLLTEPVDEVAGRRRARAAALLALALPGTAYVYQGDELGLPEVRDIPAHLRQDPVFEQSGRTHPGRDGSRVPLPWSGAGAPFGFSPAGATAEPWLPQPAAWAGLTAAAQAGDPASMLELYRAALRIRRERLLDSGPVVWSADGPQDVLAFRRGAITCILNAGPTAVPVPPGEVLLTSDSLTPADDGARLLPPDAAVWLLG